MRNITATEAARKFSELLDAIERGEEVTITRGRVPIAVMRPAPRHTGAELIAALEGIEPPDDRFENDIDEARAYVIPQERDPWADV